MLSILIVSAEEAAQMKPQDVLQYDYVLVQESKNEGSCYCILTPEDMDEPMKRIGHTSVTRFTTDLDNAKIVEKIQSSSWELD